MKSGIIRDKKDNVTWVDFVHPRLGKKSGHPSAINLNNEGNRQAQEIDDLVVQKVFLDWIKEKSIFSTRQSIVYPRRDLKISHNHLVQSIARINDALGMSSGTIRLRGSENAGYAVVSIDTATYLSCQNKIHELCEAAINRRQAAGPSISR